MKKEEYKKILRKYLDANKKFREYYRNNIFINDDYLKLEKEYKLAEKEYMKLHMVEQLID